MAHEWLIDPVYSKIWRVCFLGSLRAFIPVPDIYFELAKHREAPYFMEIPGLEKVVPFSSCCLLFVEILATSVYS